MRLDSYAYTVRAIVTFSKVEVDALLRVSSRHYDGVCRSIGRPGKGSFLWGMRMSLRKQDKQITIALPFRELDLLAKLVEMSPYQPEDWVNQSLLPLAMQLCKALQALNEETRRVNGWARRREVS